MVSDRYNSKKENVILNIGNILPSREILDREGCRSINNEEGQLQNYLVSLAFPRKEHQVVLQLAEQIGLKRKIITWIDNQVSVRFRYERTSRLSLYILRREKNVEYQ